MTKGVSNLFAVPFSIESMGLKHNTFNLLNNGGTCVNYAVYDTKDNKYVSVGTLEYKFWKRFCEVIGKEEWKVYVQTSLMTISNIASGMKTAFPKEELEKVMVSKTRDEWTTSFDGEEVCCAPVLELNELRGHEYHVNNRTFNDIEVELNLPFVGEKGTKKTNIREVIKMMLQRFN